MNAPFPLPTFRPAAGNRREPILDLVGDTPVVLAERLSPPGREVWLKLECANPMGSVKDRLALGLIEAAERDGSLKPGQTVVEATSGNTGIGLALVCARKGYPLVIVMAESFSVERRRILRFLGARVVLTPAALKGTGMVEKARELADEHGWFLPRQFENENNEKIHEETTGMEIVRAFADAPLHAFVSGLGTGGTIAGVGRALKRHMPATRIVACEPENSPVLASGVPQQYANDDTPSVSHPRFSPHPMQGWTPDFIPAVTARAIADGVIDEIRPVSGEEAMEWSQRLAREEGVFCGITSGATFATARKLASEMPEGSRVLAMIPDTGERYMTTPLFAAIEDEMNEDEMAISNSTPGAQFEASPAKLTLPMPSTSQSMALDHVDELIARSDEHVVFFGQGGCEHCRAAEELLELMGISHRAVRVDGPAYADPAWASEVRLALSKRCEADGTVPQIFVGGRHFGGAIDLFHAFNDGRLEETLDAAGIAYLRPALDDAFSLLPEWLHAR